MATSMTKDLIPMELRGKGLASPLDFEQMYKFAQVLMASGIFEDVTDVAQAFVKVARGAELGIPPTTAMQGFDLIKKRLFIKPWVIAAKINSCGYGSYEVQEQTPSLCAIAFRRKYAERGWVTLPLVTYTIEEAKGHGLVSRSPHWQTSPANMLYQRCMGRGGAMYFPELLAGLTPPPEDAEPDPAQLRHNVTLLYGEGPDPTAPSARVPLMSVAPSEIDPLRQRINDLLHQHGVSEDGIAEYWQKMEGKYPDLDEPTVLTMLYEQLQTAAEKRREEGARKAPSMPQDMSTSQDESQVTHTEKKPTEAPHGVGNEYLAGKDRDLFLEGEGVE